MKILAWAPLLEELEGLGATLEVSGNQVLVADSVAALVALAVRERPGVILLDEELPGGPLVVIRELRAGTMQGPASRFLVRSLKSTRAPADGVLAIPRGEGLPALLSALTRLLSVPVRAASRAYTLIEARGRAAGQRRHDGLLADVSVSGIKLSSPDRLRLGENTALAFTLAPGQPLLVAGARVVRDAGEEHGRFFYGLEFNDLGAEERAAIASYVDAALTVTDGSDTAHDAARVAARELASV